MSEQELEFVDNDLIEHVRENDDFDDMSEEELELWNFHGWMREDMYNPHGEARWKVGRPFEYYKRMMKLVNEHGGIEDIPKSELSSRERSAYNAYGEYVDHLNSEKENKSDSGVKE